ncbi:MAG: PEP-CTERM sorting domain-containing protein [Planctomycetaceae bacterium]
MTTFTATCVEARRFSKTTVSRIVSAAGITWTALLCALAGSAQAAPYASNLTVSGTTVSFILNESADFVGYSINGGPKVPLLKTSGSQTFFLDSPTDSFSIEAYKALGSGWIRPTGATTGSSSTGLSLSTSNGGFSLISSDANPLGRFNNPRGVTVNVNPNTPNFGTAYISNSGTVGVNYSVAAGSGSIGGSAARSLVTKGMYALRADQSDAFGYGNTGQNTAWANSNSVPWKSAVAPDGDVYISDFSDASGNVWRMSPTLTGGTAVLSGTGGPSTVPAGQYHGSTTTVWVTGTGAAMTLFTIDEDLTPAGVPGAVSTSTTSKLNVWAYALGTNAVPFATPPSLVNPSPYLINSSGNVVRGADGKYYISQNRSGGLESGIFVLDATTGTSIYTSLAATRALLSNTSAPDIFTNTMGIAVSPDQRWLAAVLLNSDVAVMPLIDGIPDISKRMLIDTGTNTSGASQRFDIAFDAANNIHYVSSGQLIYRVLATGGETLATTSYSGGVTSFSMVMAVPEPSSIALAAAGLAGGGLAWRRRRLRRRSAGG